MLRAGREAAGLTQQALALAIGPATYSSKISVWEAGREIPREYHMEALIQLLGLDWNQAVVAYYEASLERAQAIRDEAATRQERDNPAARPGSARR